MPTGQGGKKEKGSKGEKNKGLRFCTTAVTGKGNLRKRNCLNCSGRGKGRSIGKKKKKGRRDFTKLGRNGPRACSER